MEPNWAAENLQVIRTLMERSALYRRALAPVMLTVGVIGCLAGTLGALIAIASVSAFIFFWLATGGVALMVSFFLVRRQSLKDREPFWSPPTRRVALALAPPLAFGFALSLITLVLWPDRSPDALKPASLPGLWMILYGCSIYSAGFFMARGIRLLGVIFAVFGLIFLADGGQRFDSAALLHVAMTAAFGGLHLAYGIYLYFTEKRNVVV